MNTKYLNLAVGFIAIRFKLKKLRSPFQRLVNYTGLVVKKGILIRGTYLREVPAKNILLSLIRVNLLIFIMPSFSKSENNHNFKLLNPFPDSVPNLVKFENFLPNHILYLKTNVLG